MISELRVPDVASMSPTRVLLIDDDGRMMRLVHPELVDRVGRHIALRYERTFELAVALLARCGFGLIVLALPDTPRLAARAMHAVAETALGTPLLLVESGGVRSGALERVPCSVVGCAGEDDMEGILAALGAIEVRSDAAERRPAAAGL